MLEIQQMLQVSESFCLKTQVTSTNINVIEYSAHADGDSCSRVCARVTLRSAPHQHERKFVGACVRKVILKHLPQPIRRQIFRTLRQLLEITPPPLSTPIVHSAGDPQHFSGSGILVSLLHRGACKVSESYNNFWQLPPPYPPK